MHRRVIAVTVLVLGSAVAACGDDPGGNGTASPAREEVAAPGAPLPMTCDAEMRRRLEAKLRAQAQLEKEPAEEDGIVYGETNSGCAQIRLPASRP